MAARMESKLENRMGKENLMGNPMRKVKIEKITLNCGAGVEPRKLEKSVKLLEILSNNRKIQKTYSKKRIPAFGLRIGQEIGAKVTFRGAKAAEMLKRLLEAVGNKLSKDQISEGYFSFGIKEYIEIPGMSYQRDIGILGFDVCVSLMRAGKRVREKKIKTGKIGNKHKITMEETIKFMEENFKTKIE